MQASSFGTTLLTCLDRVLSQVEDYLDVFARFKRKENVDAVERLLDGTPFERYERSQLGKVVLSNMSRTCLLFPSKSLLC